MFYDFIINKARGKSGPLFSFDVHEDVRVISDASVEKDEVSWLLIFFMRARYANLLAHRSSTSCALLKFTLATNVRNSKILKIKYFTFLLQSHAGKVVLRTWYERNKHIFPASRWEPYDPEKKWEKYTVSTGVPTYPSPPYRIYSATPPPPTPLYRI